MECADAGLQAVAAGVQGSLPQLRLRPRATDRFHALICRPLERGLVGTDPHQALLQPVLPTHSLTASQSSSSISLRLRSVHAVAISWNQSIKLTCLLVAGVRGQISSSAPHGRVHCISSFRFSKKYRLQNPKWRLC
ncbi:hypothetical protein ACFX15_029036 [Malus domestica]